MNAIEFVKKYKINTAKKVIKMSLVTGKKGLFYSLDDKCYYGAQVKNRVCVDDLKQIVEAFEFIEKEFESVEIAYCEYMVSGCYSDPFWIKAKQSIELVEKCNA